MHTSCVFALLGLIASSVASPHWPSSSIQYSTVTGYFLQDNNSTNATSFDYVATNFGLINQTYSTDNSSTSSLSQWQRFAILVSHLQSTAPQGVQYKVIWAGRHGEGYHNAAESYYTTPAWNCYYSLLLGNSTVTWADAHLTTSGITQALKANSLWSRLIATQNIPTPESYYVSPLYRCLQTAYYTFTNLSLPSSSPFVPTIKAKLRESISEHTCDHRSNASYIKSSFPSYRFEQGFPFYDQLWTGVTAETDSAQDLRSQQLLDDVFTHDTNTYISFTSHSGEIGSILRVLGHRTFSLNTGAVIPVLVKAEMGQGTSTISAEPWTASPHCTAPPATSVSGGANGGCVCPNGASPVTTTLSVESTFVVKPTGS